MKDSKITEVFYYEIPLGTYPIEKASKYNFFSNVIGMHPMFDKRYEDYEMEQMKMKNKIIGDAVKNKEISNPKVSSTIFGISSVCNRAIIITEI